MPRKKVLFIDDDLDIHEVMAICLEEDDIELFCATDTSAIAIIPYFNPDLILMDEWLPDKTGSDCCTELKRDETTCFIPVVLISAVWSLDVIARRCHADAYICKPFDVDYLKKVIHDLLFVTMPASNNSCHIA